MGSCIGSFPLWQHGQAPASRKIPVTIHLVNTEIKVRTFQDISCVSGSPEHKVLAGLLDKPMHFFGFFGLLATGAGMMTGSLLLFQKAIARTVFNFQRHSDLCDDRSILAGAQSCVWD